MNEKLIKFLSDGYELGGVATSVKRDGTESGVSIRGKSAATLKEPHCLYPGDLYPYTRRPLFIIIDSDNSFVFAHIPKYFGQPLVILMSPQDVPQNFQGKGWYRRFILCCLKIRRKLSFRSSPSRFVIHTIPTLATNRPLLHLQRR